MIVIYISKMMTAMTTILAMIPAALGIGDGSDADAFQRPPVLCIGEGSRESRFISRSSAFEEEFQGKYGPGEGREEHRTEPAVFQFRQQICLLML